jgi:hypothetical protein
VRRFLDWVEGQGVELKAITPGMVGQYLVGLRPMRSGACQPHHQENSDRFGWSLRANFHAFSLPIQGDMFDLSVRR